MQKTYQSKSGGGYFFAGLLFALILGACGCWMLHKDYQGKGYAFEAAQAFFDHLFRDKGIRRIYAYTEDYNLSCQRLCEKLGMRREGLFLEFVSFVNNPDGTPLYENTFQYAILKKEWLARK